jgi:hypothetical protein
MNPAQFRVHIEAYLNLRSSLGFQTEYETYNLRALSDYIEAKGSHGLSARRRYWTGSMPLRFTVVFPGRECD